MKEFSSKSFQGIFIRQLHTGNDDPQDYSARSIFACRSDLNTVGIDGLDIGIASWNINHFQKADMKRASMQRIFFQHQEWLDILVLQEVNASSNLKIDDTEIKAKEETGVEKKEKEKPKIRKLVYEPGPMMMGLSIGEEPTDSDKDEKSEKVKSRLGYVGGKPAWLKPHQQEFYPLVYLEGGKYEIEHLTSAAFYLNELTDIKDLKGRPLYWNKQFGTDGDGTDTTQQNTTASSILSNSNQTSRRTSRSTATPRFSYIESGGGTRDEEDSGYKGETKTEKREIRQENNMRDINPKLIADAFKIDVDLTKIPYFRPIIVHKLLINKLPVNIAVVHTSPEGGKLARKGEYEQIAPFFKYVSSDTSGALWVIAGDYYLDPESNIASNSAQKSENPDELFKEQIKAYNLKFVISVSATNQSVLDKKASTEREKNLRERESLQKKIEENPEVIRQNLAPKIDEKVKQKIDTVLEKDPQSSIEFIGYTTPYQTTFDSVQRETEKSPSHAVNKRADFFLCSQAFTNTFAGIIHPVGGLLNVDPNHNALNWWRLISDHAPVGAVFSTLPVSEKLRRIRNDEKLLNSKRWGEAEVQLSEIFRKAYEEIQNRFIQLRSAIKQDWGDGLDFEKKLFYLLLFYTLTDGRFKAFQTVDLGEIKDMTEPDYVAAELVKFFELCEVCNTEEAENKKYEAFRAIYIKQNNWSHHFDNATENVLAAKFCEHQIKEKFNQMKYSILPKLVYTVSSALRALGYELGDFDVTDKEQTYGEVKSTSTF